MQIESHRIDGTLFQCPIPDASEAVLDDVLWGDVDRVFTPAFWRFAYLTHDGNDWTSSYRLGETLEQELVACLLGGHGITGEVTAAAFIHLKNAGVFDGDTPNESELHALLSRPISIRGRPCHYRFPAQKARYIAAALTYMRHKRFRPSTPRELREWLTNIPGVGLKTASWVVRNRTDADDIAILDIHIHRAGVLADLFSSNDDVVNNYRSMEERFVRFAAGIQVPANILDSVIWNRLRGAPRLVRRELIERGIKVTDRCGLPPAHDRRAPRDYELFPNT